MFSFHQQVQILHWHMWWSAPAATCAGGVFPSSSWRKYFTCTCGGHHPLQLALVVFFPPTTGANTLLALVQLALCGGGCMWWWYIYVVVVSVAVYSSCSTKVKTNKHRTVAKRPAFDGSPYNIIACNQPPQILYLQMWWSYCNLHQVVVVIVFQCPSYS